MKNFLLIFLLFFLKTHLLFSKKLDIEKDFLKTLNEVSEIATVKRLNLDKTPATVTVIKEDFIKKSGAKNLLDIIEYIPGIEISQTSSGKKQIILRGIKSTYIDKIKLLINGVDVTNNLYSNQFYYYNFPASLIKRVEFTKSPDSILYGSNAFLGVINIITYNEEDKNFIYLYKGDKNSYNFTFFNNYSINETTVSLDAFYSFSKPYLSSPKTVKINLLTHDYSLFRNEVSAHSLEKDIGLGVKIKKYSHSLIYRLKYYKKGNFFGISRVTPLKDDKFVDFTHQFLIYNYSKFLTSKLKIDFQTGIKHYVWDGEFRAFPYDLQPTDDPSKDLIIGGFVKEKEFFIRNILKYFDTMHNFTFLTEYKYAKPYDFYYLEYIDKDTPQKFRGEKNLLKKGINTKILSISLKDLVILNDYLSFILGARLDNYNNFGNNYSYKTGFVYNVNEKNTFKFLYNRSFRAPSWIELYAKSATEFNGNENLKPEKISLFEFQYLKNFTKSDILKINLYTGKIKDNIDRLYDKNSGKRVYENLGDLTIKGIEASFTKLFSNENKFNISISKNSNSSEYKEYLGARKFLLNSYLIINFDKFSSFTSLKYGDKIKTPPIIEDVDEYFSLNQVFTIKSKNYEFQFGVKNLTNKKNFYWIQPTDIINRFYMFVPIKAKVPSLGREFFIVFKKSW